VARLSLERLIVDGRIHPARIEELIEKASKDVEEMILEAGENALLETGTKNMHPELMKLIGQLRFRSSYGQNALAHSLEVSHLSGIMAAELGVELEIVESSWANSILDVQSGKVDLAFALTALPKRALAVHFSAPTYYNSFVIISPRDELAGKTWAELNDPAYTIAVDLGSSQDQITKAYLPKANILRFKTRDEAILAVSTGKADAIINTVFNSMVMTKKNAAIGKVHVPTPILSSPSVVGLAHDADDVWRGFVSAWADYNRRVGNNQTWILKGLEPFGITADDLPEGFDING